MDNLIGKQLGDFTILERIGQGGMATVYRAEQGSMKRDVAVKVISVIETSEHDDFFRRFEKEAAMIASLEHARILPVHNYGIEGNWAYMAMRYLRGGSLKEVVRKGRLPLHRTLELFEQITSALAYAHSKGIIHRDLKLANIMLDDDGNAYLTDFGLAKMIKGDGDSTQSGHIVGTITNMAPEQLRGDPIDHRADIYSLGIILYEMAVGETPFSHEKHADLVTLIYQHLEDDPVPPSTYDKTIPPELEKTIMKAIEKRPDQRFASVADMLQSLEPLMASYSSTVFSLPTVDQTLLDRARTTDSIIQAKQPRQARKIDPLSIITVTVIGLIILLFALSLAGNLFLRDTAPTPIPKHTVLAGVSATGSEIAPTLEQIEAAKIKLGNQGFVAIIACNLDSEYHATLNREIGTFLLSYGIDRRVYNSDNEKYDQIPILEQAMAEGAEGIILCPLEYDLLDNPLQTIEEKEIPFVSLTREDNLYGGVQLSSTDDNYSMGFTVGEFAGQIILDELDGEAKVVILDFPDQPVIVERANGLEEGVLSVAPDVEIVGRYPGGFSDNGQDAVEDLLDDEIEFNVILSINDAGSYGAIDALEEADIPSEDVMIFSIDAERKAVDYMREGRFIRGSLSVGRQETAQAASDIMVRMLAGAEVPQSIAVDSGAMITPDSLSETSD